MKAGGEVPELPPRQQTDTLAVSTAPGNHTDVSAMRRRLALASPAQPVSSSIKDDAIDEVSEPLKSTKHSRASFHADDEVVEQLELASVQIEEEEFNVEEGSATDQSLNKEKPANVPAPGDNLDGSTIETLSAGGDIPRSACGL